MAYTGTNLMDIGLCVRKARRSYSLNYQEEFQINFDNAASRAERHAVTYPDSYESLCRLFEAEATRTKPPRGPEYTGLFEAALQRIQAAYQNAHGSVAGVIVLALCMAGFAAVKCQNDAI